MKRDVLTPHLAHMKALNAGYQKLLVGTRRSPRAYIVFDTVRGRVRVRNRLTGTTAYADEPEARAALLAEVGPWLEFIRLRLRWETARHGRRRAAAAQAFIAHMLRMKAAGLASPTTEARS